MAEVKNFYSPCRKCKTKTRHIDLCKSEGHGDEDYHYYSCYAVIQCLGCETKSFRYLWKDIEQAWQVGDDEWEVPEGSELYPQYDPSHVDLDDVYIVPKLVRDIYQEAVIAVRADALTLAGLGLRGTIEAVCNEQQIKGSNLEKRITKMATTGVISKTDADRLHAIRFLGNDAAHDIKRPDKDQISVALKIINHLIQSVYILKIEAEGKLDTILVTSSEFVEILDSKIMSYKSGDEFPLTKFFGKDIRRLGSSAPAFESQLKTEITAGNYTKLKIGKIEKYNNSPSDLQHFIVV
jgi:hypothetical protein